MNALAGGEYKQRLRAVDSITGGCLLRAWLQKCAFRQRFAARAAQYGENRTDRDIHIDIGGTVERVAQQQICALCAAVRDEMNLRHFFGRDCCERAAGRCFFKQNLIGDQVQFLLDFALYIFLPSAAKRATERALIHLAAMVLHPSATVSINCCRQASGAPCARRASDRNWLRVRCIAEIYQAFRTAVLAAWCS